MILIALIEELPYVSIEVQKSIRKVEKWSRFIYFVVVYVTVVCGMAPKLILSLFFYYVKDLGSDAFQLTIPMW